MKAGGFVKMYKEPFTLLEFVPRASVRLKLLLSRTFILGLAVHIARLLLQS